MKSIKGNWIDDLYYNSLEYIIDIKFDKIIIIKRKLYIDYLNSLFTSFHRPKCEHFFQGAHTGSRRCLSPHSFERSRNDLQSRSCPRQF